MHENSRLMFIKYAKEYFQPQMRVLEIGPDSFPSTYQSIINDSSIHWDTLDIHSDARLTYQALSEYSFPIASNSYDIVLSGQVLEHVRKIWVWIKEVARICKNGGFVITISPVSWIYHEDPHDCWRAYPEGMKSLYDEAALEVILSTWQSLEIEINRKTIPGISRECQSWQRRLAYTILEKFGFPVECSYDTITIGKKLQE
jgi:SAM-dependent methyltransferase